MGKKEDTKGFFVDKNERTNHNISFQKKWAKKEDGGTLLRKSHEPKMKDRITITIDKKLLKWLDNKTEQKIFANRSHGFEFLVCKEIRNSRGSNIGKTE